MVSLPGLQSWREALDVDVVCSCLEWTPPTGVIWRGDIYFTENKVSGPSKMIHYFKFLAKA